MRKFNLVVSKLKDFNYLLKCIILRYFKHLILLMIEKSVNRNYICIYKTPTDFVCQHGKQTV